MRLWLLVVAVVLTGCDVDNGVALTRWRLGGELVTTPADVVLPRNLELPGRDGRYSLESRVELPAAWRGKPLTLALSDLPAIVHVTVDGVPAMLTEAGLSPVRYRVSGPRTWRIPAVATEDGVLELALVVEHRWTQSGWWGSAPRLVAGDGRPIDTQVALVFNVYIAVAAVISLVQIALTALLVYLFDRKRRAYLWFAAQTSAAAYYPLFILGVTQVPLGRMDVPVLAMMLVSALIASVWFTHAFFDLRPPSRVFIGVWLLMLVTLLVFGGPFETTQYAGPLTVAILVGVTGYQLVICGRLALRHPDRVTARLQLAAWLGLGTMQPPDLIHWLGGPDLLGGARVASLGLVLFATALSLLLGRRHISSLRLEAEHLEKARAEVEQLNVELRRQVAERSAQLFAALAIAGGRAARAPELTHGELVRDRYKVIREVGRGGMGTVYEVERISDGRRLALKLTHELTGSALARLAREALIASKISHPNLVGVIDVDVAASGFLYVVMELVVGTSLKAAKEFHGDPVRALPVLAQIADGLAALHATGVVHRDLKPANVLLAGGATVKITDFGVSRRMPGAWPEDGSTDSAESPFDDMVDDDKPETVPLDPKAFSGDTIDTQSLAAVSSSAKSSVEPNLTRTGMLVGTPAYIAPELVDGPEALSPAADLFAFGVIAFELITGDRPFSRPAAIARMQGKDPDPPAPIAWRWTAAVPEVAAVIDRCLLGDPTQRPTAADVAEVLAKWRP